MHPVAKECIADAGKLTQALGMGRVLGLIYAYLYFSKEPKGLLDLQNDLEISRGSSSMSVRQLEQYGAVRKVWVKGDRKDYYVANDWFGRVMKNIMTDLIAKRFADRDSFYDSMYDLLEQTEADQDSGFVRDRLDHIKAFENKAKAMWNNPFVQHFFK